MSLEEHQPSATVVPVILSSDKMQLTVFGGKDTYPIYLTIGNIPKDIRRKPSCLAQLLIGYILTTKLKCFEKKASRQHALANLFHFCMRKVIALIQSYGETGISMMSSNGTWHQCYPIFAVFIGDYPEQSLVTFTKRGCCPKCLVPPNQLGEFLRFPLQDHAEIVSTFFLADKDIPHFYAACHDTGLKPVYHPFWQMLPLVNISLSITPNILHQLLQGVIRHLVAWLTSPTAFGQVEINVHCQSFPPNHHTKLFTNGITSLSCASGKEHKDICHILLGLVINLPLLNGQGQSCLVKAVCALLDFMYLAQYPSHATHTLHYLEESSCSFPPKQRHFH